MEIIRYEVSDVVKLKKSHPCGSDLWEIYRTGLDFGLKCLGCGHRVMVARPKFEKAVKQRWPKGEGSPLVPTLQKAPVPKKK